MFDIQAKRDLNNGLGDSLARAFELVVTPLVFAVIGYFIDRWLNTRPIFMLGLGIWTFAYVVWRAFGEYSHKMEVHEQKLGSRTVNDA